MGVQQGNAMWLPIAAALLLFGGSVEPPCSAYWAADAVFVGQVESIRRTGAIRTITFDVIETVRGVKRGRIDVSVAASGSRCRTAFRVGQEYFVYASRTGSADWTVTDCDRARKIEDAAADASYARSVADGSAASGTLTGQIRRARRDLSGKQVGVTRPLAGVGVSVWRDGVSASTVTNDAGEYALAAAGSGRHVIRLQLPEAFYADMTERVVDLRDGRACLVQDVLAYENGRIDGRVVDGAGRPIAGLTLELSVAAAANGARRRTLTDRHGHYEFDRLPSRQFVVGVTLGDGRRSKAQGVYFPGVDRLAAASRVTIAAGARVTLTDFVMPAHVKLASVSGVVFDANGTPAEGARVYLRTGDEGRILTEPSPVDFLGRFVLTTPAIAGSVIFAERPRGTRIDSSDPVPLTASIPLKLVLIRRY